MTRLCRIIASVVAMCFLITGCTTFQPPTTMVAYGAAPQTQHIKVTEDSLLACFTQYAWTPRIDKKTGKALVRIDKQTGKPVLLPINIKVTNVTDQTGKGTYGDTGTGAMLPVDSASTAMAALKLAHGGTSPVEWFDGTDGVMKVMLNEAALGMRDASDMQAPKMDYYLVGNTVSADSMKVLIGQVIAYGVGGGPREERWSFDLNLRLIGWKNGQGAASSEVFNQYVQQELKGVVANVFGGGSSVTAVTADLESVVRSKLQSLMRPMIYAGTADLLSQIEGAPPTCVNKVRQYLAPKTNKPAPKMAWLENSPAAMPREMETVALAA